VFKKLSQDGGFYRATTAAPATSDSIAEAMKPLFTLRRTGRPELELVPEGPLPEEVLDPEGVVVVPEAADAVLLTVTPKLDEEPPTGVTVLMVGPAAPEEFPELLDVAVEEASLLETSGPTLKEGVVA
jgi:hypothetical protein